MKRSRLNRRTPLKRSPLKRQSEKKKREREETDGPRRDYRKLFKTCQCCESQPSEHTHEIASGGSRAQSVYHRETYLAVCAECHAAIHETSDWPLSRQLWCKQRGDPEHYCRQLVLRLKGWDEEAITQQEVDAWRPRH